MAISRLQGTASNNGGFTSATYGGACTPGSLLTASIRIGNTTDVPTISDPTNGTWALAYSQVQTTDGHKMWVFYLPNNAASSALVVSFNSTSAGCRYAIEEFSGVATSSPVRGSPASAQGDAATSVASGNLTASLGDLAYGSGTNDNGAAFTWTAGGTSAGGSWAIGLIESDTNHPLVTQYVVATAGGTFASQPVYGAAANITSGIVLFKAAVANQIGDANVEATTDAVAVSLLRCSGPFTAGAGGDLAVGWVYCNYVTVPTNIEQAVYIDNGSNYPGVLLDQTGAIVVPAAAGWVHAAYVGENIVSGTKYWIAMRTSTVGAVDLFYNSAAGSGLFNNTDPELAFPGTFPAGYSAFTATYSAYATFTPFPPFEAGPIAKVSQAVMRAASF